MLNGFPFIDRVVNRLARALPRRTIDISISRPIVSFTFDDVPDSALSNGARLLEAHGVRGTFYAAGGLTGGEHDGLTVLDEDGYRELVRRGHEIGHHTFSHRRPAELGRDYGADLDRNDAFLATVMEGKARNFAFPYGLSSPRAQHELGRRFRSGRSVHAGVNRGITDLDYLDSIDIRPTSDDTQLLGWIDDAVTMPGWLIFFTHDVSDTPGPFGCTPGRLDRLIASALANGCEVLTVDAALDRLGVAP